MPTVYGSDIAALTDLPDPEIIVLEDDCAAFACARRWLTADGALQEIGETEQYDSIDVTEWLGGNIDLNDPSVINDLEAQATQVLYDEPYAQGGVQVTASYNGGKLTLTGIVKGAPGPFSLVIANGAAGVTADLILPGQTA